MADLRSVMSRGKMSSVNNREKGDQTVGPVTTVHGYRTCKWMEVVTTLGGSLFVLLAVILAVPVILIRETIHAVLSAFEVNVAKLGKLEGKVVLITGANSGIGESVAQHFYKAGCKVILAARRRHELERVRDSLLKMTVPDKRTYAPTVLELDLSNNSKMIASKAQEAIAIHGGIDILVNNAGVYNMGYVLDTVMDVDEHIMAVNYLGTLALTKVIGNHMRAQKQGQIVFVSSVLGKISITNSLSYSASKHALQALADSLRAEVTPDGIKITIISPSYVNTPISVNALSSSGDKYGLVTKEVESGYSVEYVSQKIFQAIVNEEADVTIAPVLDRVSIYARLLTPNLFFIGARIYGRRFRSQYLQRQTK